MRFSSIVSIASLASFGMAAPALNNREEQAAADVAQVTEEAPVANKAIIPLGGAANAASIAGVVDLGLGQGSAIPVYTGGARDPLVISISASARLLEGRSFDKLDSINLLIRNAYGVKDKRQLETIESGLTTTLRNLYQDIQDATRSFERVTSALPRGLVQGDVQLLTDASNSLQRTLIRITQVLVNAEQILPKSVKKTIQPDVDVVKGSIRGLIAPITRFIDTVIQVFPTLNLTALLASSQTLLRAVSTIIRLIGLPNLRSASELSALINISVDI